MILDTVERWEKTPRYIKRGKKSIISIVLCDVCKQTTYELPASYARKKKFHICNDICNSIARTKEGIVYNESIKTCTEKYGAKFASQVPEIKQKCIETNLKKYGFKASSLNQEVEQKRYNTCIERYGGPAATSDPEIVAKAQQTTIDKYGGPVLLNEEIREKVNNTMCDRYGVMWPSQNAEIFNKQCETNLERYGVRHPFHTMIAKENARSPESHRKRHETMKQNGTYGTSKPENFLYEMLICEFGEQNIERQYFVNRWPIDFFVKTIAVYVQYDSYWHGIGRTLDEVAEYKCDRDIIIYQKMLTDIKQNDYFNEHKMKLVRIINDEYKDRQIVITKIMGLL